MKTLNELLINLGAEGIAALLFNLNKIKKDVVIVSFETRGSKYHPIGFNAEHDSKRINDSVAKYTKIDFKLKKTKSIFKFKLPSDFINSDYKKTIDILVDKLYKEFLRKIDNSKKDDLYRKVLVSSFSLRGSVDLKMNYFAIDLNKNIQTKKYVDRILSVVAIVADFSQFNLNYREFQPEYVAGINKRNTQFRINLKYFSEYKGLLIELKQINPWKFEIIEHNLKEISMKKLKSKLSWKKLIAKKARYDEFKLVSSSEYTSENIMKLKLNFFDKSEKNYKSKRNHQIIQFAKIHLKDFCFGCCDRFPIGSRTFKKRGTNLYYLEINHVFPFSFGNTDVYENLVKLCPPCHKALSPGRAEKSEQMLIIESMLMNRKESSHFIENFMDVPYTLAKKKEFIYSRLK